MIECIDARRGCGRARLLVGCTFGMLAFAALAPAGTIFDDDWQPPTPLIARPPTSQPAPSPAPPATAAPATAVPRETKPAAAIVTPPPAEAARPTVAPAPTPAPPVASDSRRPIPPKADRTKSRLLMRQVYAAELGNSAPGSRKALGAKLLQEASQSNSVPADEFVLLSGAIEAAQEAADLPMAFRAADEMAKAYAIDRTVTKEQSLLRIAPKTSAKNRVDNLRAGLELFSELEPKDDYERAERVGAVVQQMAASDPKQRTALQHRIQVLQDQRMAREQGAAALALLKTAPDDPAANTAAGRFYCFVQGEWKRGLPLLAKGADETLKAIAAKDLAQGRSAADSKALPSSPEALGDAWWAAADKEAAANAKQKLQGRAVFWYEQALPKLVGLDKMRVQKRTDAVPPEAVPVDVRTIVNTAAVHEAQAIVGEIARHYPEVLRGITQVEFAKYHDATELHGGGPIQMVGAYAPEAKRAGGGGITLANIYEPWPAGRYLIVYRIQALADVQGDNICFLDVCHDSGNTIASRRPNGREFVAGTWISMPIALELSHDDTLEYRLWANDHELAMDRVYILRLK